jgi:hypothetical protein
VARGLELDWVVIRVQPLRTMLAVCVVGLVAASLVYFAYKSLNVSPQTRAQHDIDRAAEAYAEAEVQPLPVQWRGELRNAAQQLETARKAFVDGRFPEASSLADSARRRFEALAGASGRELVGAGQFFSLEGRVEIQRAGQSAWEDARQQQPVFNGDFVRTGRDGDAEILFADGSLYRVAANSLLEIHQESSRGSPRTVKMVVGKINVYTSGTPSTVTTDSVETEIDRDSRVAVDVAADDQGTTVSAFQGSARVRNTRGDEVVVRELEAVAANAAGTMADKQEIPPAPLPLAPQNNLGFDVSKRQVVELSWRGRPEQGTVHLQVGRAKSFEPSLLDVDAPELARDSARLRLVAPGTYFWRVACRRAAGSPSSEWSSVRRFRVFSTPNETVIADTTPPELIVKPAQQLGHMFIIEGTSESSATVTVNGELVEMGVGGVFRKTVEIPKAGWNDILVVATDPSGNRVERRQRVFVEVY